MAEGVEGLHLKNMGFVIKTYENKTNLIHVAHTIDAGLSDQNFIKGAITCIDFVLSYLVLPLSAFELLAPPKLSHGVNHRAKVLRFDAAVDRVA